MATKLTRIREKGKRPRSLLISTDSKKAKDQERAFLFPFISPFALLEMSSERERERWWLLLTRKHGRFVSYFGENGAFF